MDNLRQSLAFEPADPARWRANLREKVAELTGLAGAMPSERCDLNVRSLWTENTELGTIEKLVFASELCADVPAYLCLPSGVTPPYPTFVCVQGHSSGMHNSIARALDDEKKTIVVEGDRDFGLGCMRRGIAALCVEQRAFGYREEKHLPQQMANNRCWDATMHALMLGRTMIGERVYDIDRGIDYLESRGDIDMAKLGVMGNSGGGTATLFSAALLDRVQFAMPSCYFCTFRDSIMSIGHCMDNYVPGLLQYAEMYDIMGTFAPKPVVIVAGSTDDIFPIGGVRHAFDRLQAVYRAFDAADRCHLVVGNGGHRFYADDAWPVMLGELGRK